MLVLLNRRFARAIIFSTILLPLTSFSQVNIKEKVEIQPHSSVRLQTNASPPELHVVSEFAGPVDPNMPALVFVKGPCGVGSSVNGASGSLSVAAYEGVYTLGYRFTSPKGGGGFFRFSVTLGNDTLIGFQGPVNCPNGCTLWSNWDIPLYRGFTFSPAYEAIWMKTDNYFVASIDAANADCAQAYWCPWLDIHLEITKGQDIGEFLGRDGRPVGTKTSMKVDDPWYTPIFTTDGTKDYGDVEITATSGGTTVVKTFPVRVHPPWVIIEPPWESLWPIMVNFANLPVLDFSEIHNPGAGQQYEPTITWDPGSSINTADYINQITDTLSFYVKVKAENPGGVAQDSSLVTLVKQCIKVTPSPPSVPPGGIASLSFQWVNPDGTLQDIPAGDFLFSVMILGGQDSSKGLLIAGNDTGTTLLYENSIAYLAPASIKDTLLEVHLEAAASWNGGGATSIVTPTSKTPRVQQLAEKLGTKRGGEPPQITGLTRVKKPDREALATLMKNSALLGSSCPISKVVVSAPVSGCPNAPECSPWQRDVPPPPITLQIRENGFGGMDICADDPDQLGGFARARSQDAIEPLAVTACFDPAAKIWKFIFPEAKLNFIETLCESQIRARQLQLLDSSEIGLIPIGECKKAKQDLESSKNYPLGTGNKSVSDLKYISHQALLFHEDAHRRFEQALFDARYQDWVNEVQSIKRPCGAYADANAAAADAVFWLKVGMTDIVQRVDETFSRVAYDPEKLKNGTSEEKKVQAELKLAWERRIQNDMVVQLMIQDLIDSLPCK